MTNCYVHDNIEAVANCVSCGNFICSDCRVLIEKKNYCTDCVKTVEQKSQSAKASSIWFIILGIILSLFGLFYNGGIVTGLIKENEIWITGVVYFLPGIILIIIGLNMRKKNNL
jgi:H+/Cl- antiporter ClcA